MEEISGRGYGDLIAELVFRPLGMTSSSMTWKPEFAGRYAVPHDRRGSLRSDSKPKAQALDSWKYADSAAAAGAAGNPELPNWMLPNAAASLVTNAPDYARFLAAAIQNPELRKAQVRFRPSLAWGLGWGIEQAAGREYLWQWGDNSGYKNFIAAEPATGSAIFVFTNGDSGVRVYDRIVTHATGHDHPALFWI